MAFFLGYRMLICRSPSCDEYVRFLPLLHLLVIKSLDPMALADHFMGRLGNVVNGTKFLVSIAVVTDPVRL